MQSRLLFFWLLGLQLAAPARLAAQASEEPPLLISLAVNQATETDTQQGWPLVVVAHVVHRRLFQEGAPAVNLVAASGSWADAVRLVVTDASGNTLPWAFQAAGGPSGALTVDSETIGDLGWWLTPEASAGITPGSYRITASLDSTAVGPPFAGLKSVSSVPVELTVQAAKPNPSDEEATRMHLLFADYFVLKGEDANAVAEVDALLAEQPANVDGLAYRAQLLHAQGELEESLAAYVATAQAYFDASPDPSEPPLMLLREYRDVLAELEAKTTFEVRVAVKTPLHPAHGQGDEKGYLIDGVEGGDLWLYEDTTYTFRMIDVGAETPFYFSTSAVGNGAAAYTDGVTGQPASGSDEVTLTPSADTPDVLYYQSMNNASMGWRIHIFRNATSVGVEAPTVTLPVAYQLDSVYPNPFNQEARFTLTVAQPQHVVIKVLNVEGREVMDLYDDLLLALIPREFVLPGAGLASGSYFIRIQGEAFTATRGVVLVR